MTDGFKTIRSEARAETKVQGSRFIATVLPVTTKTAAEQFTARIKREFWDATHNCFAFRVGPDGKEFRFNDDGEPGGSAGRPILAAIERCELTDVAVVVSRFFGGTKLGVGGLVRAYGDAAEQVLQKAEKLTKYRMRTIEVTIPHSHISNVMHIVSKLGATIVDTQYDEEVHVQVEIRVSMVDELKSALANKTSGNAHVKGE